MNRSRNGTYARMKWLMLTSPGVGGGVLTHKTYMGTCRPMGHDFGTPDLERGIHNFY